MDCQKLFSIIDSLNEEYCNIWENVCNIESPTNYKDGVDAVGNVFIKMAAERGWFVDVLEQTKAGNAICITINHESKAEPIVFSGHIDTVHPIGLFGTPAVHRDEKCIYGPGVMDCKGGVVASFMALEALEKCGFTRRPVKLIIQTDEETGSKTSKKETVKFMIEQSKNALAFLNTEGIHGNTAIISRKGIIRYNFTVRGKAAHSSKCFEGANAILEAAHKIIQLEKIKDADGLTCNCGLIKGGTVANTVAAVCSFSADIRFANNEQCTQALKLVKEISENTTIEGCSCQFEEVSNRPSMELTDKNRNLLNRINEIYQKNGLPVLNEKYGLGGSDAAYSTQAGIPTVDSIGVDGGNIHSINEYSYLDSLAASAKRLAAVAYSL